MESLREIAAASSMERPAFTHNIRLVNGKLRTIAAPNWAMRLLHHAVIERLEKIEGLNAMLHNSYGALRGGTILANASRHANNRYVYQVDIKNAYPSVPLRWLADALSDIDPELGTGNEIEEFLREFCAGSEGGLATGGPASPALFDLYCSMTVDPEIRRACPRAMYSRYHDDITISTDEPIPSILRKRVRAAITSAGFSVNHTKSRVVDRTKHAVTITGVVLTQKGTVRPPVRFIERVKNALLVPPSAMSPRQILELQGLAGHLSLFSDRYEWPYGNICQDVKYLRSQVIRALRSLGHRGPRTRNEVDESGRRFSQRFLDEVRANAPLEKVVAECFPGMVLKKRGREFTALCPFHNEKTPSFTVAPEKGFYHCFGCSAHGDAIRLLMDIRRLTFPEAVRKLADDYNLHE